MSAKGIDVSQWQGPIDWPTLRAAGYSFAVVRACHGPVADRSFAMHYDGATAAGLIVGAYYYADPGIGWQEGADAFKEATEARPVAFVAYDLEDAALVPYDAAIDALAWLRYVEHPAAYVYTGVEPATRLWLAQVPELGEWPLWCASWTPAAHVPAPWTSWAVWQHAVSRAPGVRGPVDLDVTAEGLELDMSEEIATSSAQHARDVGAAYAAGIAGPSTLGARALEVARGELGRGVREMPPGSNTGPDVRAYLAPCVRNGRRLGLTVGAWCAAFASWCVWEAWLTGASSGPSVLTWTPDARPAFADLRYPPIGYRAAVSELVDDARATGTWRPAQAAEEPRPGDLLVWSHHVGLCEVWAPGERAAICGNDGDAVARVDLGTSGEHPRCGPLLGWVRLG